MRARPCLSTIRSLAKHKNYRERGTNIYVDLSHRRNAIHGGGMARIAKQSHPHDSGKLETKRGRTTKRQANNADARI